MKMEKGAQSPRRSFKGQNRADLKDKSHSPNACGERRCAIREEGHHGNRGEMIRKAVGARFTDASHS